MIPSGREISPHNIQKNLTFKFMDLENLVAAGTVLRNVALVEDFITMHGESKLAVKDVAAAWEQMGARIGALRDACCETIVAARKESGMPGRRAEGWAGLAGCRAGS